MAAAPRRAAAAPDELFTASPPPRPARPRHLKGCAVCGEPGTAAHPDHQVCTVCADRPGFARARVEAQRRIVVANQNRAAQEAQAAYDALSDEERARWGAYCALRAKRDNGDAAPDEVARLARSRSALADPDDARYSAALRRTFHADEDLFWANAACDDGQRRCDVRLAALALCLEALQ